MATPTPELGLKPEFDITTAAKGDTIQVLKPFVYTEGALAAQVEGYRDFRNYLGSNQLVTVSVEKFNASKGYLTCSTSGYNFRLTKDDSIFIKERVRPIVIVEGQDSSALKRVEYRKIADFVAKAQRNGAEEREKENTLRIQAIEEARVGECPAAQRSLGQVSQHNRAAQAWETVAKELDALLTTLQVEPAPDGIQLASITGTPLATGTTVSLDGREYSLTPTAGFLASNIAER